MKTFRYTFAALAALCVGLTSCVKDNTEPVPAPDLYEQGFYLGTRADGDENAPADKDAFTLLAYRRAHTTSEIAYSTQIKNSDNMKQFGYYAYDQKGEIGKEGDLIPVAVNATTYMANPFARSQTNGLQLVGIPVTGTSTTNTGFYNVAMIHPAIPVRNASDHGYLAVFNRNDNIYASHPLDRNGDGNQNDPFDIGVRENMQVHPVAADVKLFPVKAAIRVYLYSHFYADDDYNTPLHVDFSVEKLDDDLKLVNAGSNGWFNPCTGVIYPNYNYRNYPKTSSPPGDFKSNYSAQVGVDIEGQNAESLTAAASSQTIPTSYSGIEATAKYLIDNVRVFPTDYRGAEGGGNPFIIPMTLSLKLKQGNGVYNKASVPIALNIKNNKVYTFYVNVKSTMIQVSYTISGWVPVEGAYDDIGGNVMDYMEVKLQSQSGDWTEQNGGSETIGG